MNGSLWFFCVKAIFSWWNTAEFMPFFSFIYNLVGHLLFVSILVLSFVLRFIGCLCTKDLECLFCIFHSSLFHSDGL